MATARSAVTRSGSPADVSIQPSAPQYTPRRTGSRSSIAWSTRGFGRAGDRRGRERGLAPARRARRRRAGGPAPCSRGGATRGATRSSTASGTRTDPGAQTRPEVVAGEVDDHHVLGVVLAAGAQRGAGGGGALDRPRLDVAVAHPQEALGRRRDDRGARRRARGAAAASRWGAGCARASASYERDRVERVVAREPAGEVDLVALAGAQQVEHGLRRGRSTSSRSRPLCQRVAGDRERVRRGAGPARPRRRAARGRVRRRARAMPPRGSTTARASKRANTRSGTDAGLGRRARGRRPARRRGRARTRTSPTQNPGPGRRARRSRRHPTRPRISAGADPDDGGAPAPHRRHRGTGRAGC